jgi:hypothetical protein
MNMLKIYRFELKDRVFDSYKAKEVFHVYSSEEEYESFKNSFFDAAGVDKQFLGKNEYLIEIYYITVNNERIRMYIGQTQNLDKCELDTHPDGTLMIREGVNEEFYSSPFCYSKNRKYFIFLPNIMEVIEAFCEIDD